LIVSKEGCGELFGDPYIFRQNISLPSIQALIAKLVIDASTPEVETFTTITTVLASTDSGNSTSWFGENG
jgi:hypothetical protein